MQNTAMIAFEYQIPWIISDENVGEQNMYQLLNKLIIEINFN